MRPRCVECLTSLGALTLALAVWLTPALLARQPLAGRVLDSSTPRTLASPGPSTFVNLDFVVSVAGSHVRIKDATVSIDHNSGNGIERMTDGAGFCNFGVISPRTYRYRVMKPDYEPVAGEVNVMGSAVTVPVQLRRAH
jgi:hypothetical protein